MGQGRVAEARRCRKSWRQWVNAVADELRQHGSIGKDRASRLEICGTRALAHECECGARHVHPLTSCGLRVCPFCSRRDATERSEKLAKAMGLLARERPRLRWRLLTLTLRWDPSAETEVSVAGLRRRFEELWRRWGCVWPLLRRHCAAVAAYASAEISDGGHVHLHVAVLSQWINPDWLASQWGDYVDVREIKGKSGAKEVAKYSLKSHSPLDADWISGRHRRLIHPRLAARWELATARRQIRRVFGELRGLESGEVLLPDDPPAIPICDDCGRLLPPVGEWQPGDTVAIVRATILARARIHWHFRPPGPP